MKIQNLKISILLRYNSSYHIVHSLIESNSEVFSTFIELCSNPRSLGTFSSLPQWEI